MLGEESRPRFGRAALAPLAPLWPGPLPARTPPDWLPPGVPVARGVPGMPQRQARWGLALAPFFLGALLLVSLYLVAALVRDIGRRLEHPPPPVLQRLRPEAPSAPSEPDPTGWTPPPLTLEGIFGAPPDLSGARREDLRVLVVTGDVIPARSVNATVLRRGDFLYPFRATADYLRGGDLLFVNLEAPLLARCPRTDEGMTFCGDARNVEGLVFAGVNVAGVANNHLGNYGPAGTEETIRNLASRGIAAAGLGQTAYLRVRGLIFAFLAYNGVGPPVDRAAMTREIGAARARADVVVVQFHWGKEYVRLPERAPGVAPDDPRDLGRAALAAGADLIIGNHPHWVQGVELVGDRLITYAHGNFVFDQMFSRETREGVVGRYTFHGRRLAAVEYRPVRIDDFAQPRLLDGPDAAAVLGQMEAASRALAAIPFHPS
jgi:poly-gamma-glutamate capsule biosynthesis protein CapA/YwtB (metallophosphatase superfamily)